jgi:nucleoside triphosphate diphosphatase
VLEKLDEEVAELRAELPAADPERLSDEVGDLLFVLANLARKLGLDPEECLRHANGKFVKRFNRMETSAATRGLALSDMQLDAMESVWQQIKHNKEHGT